MKLLLSPREINLGKRTSMGVGSRGLAYEPRTVEEFRDVLHYLTVTGTSQLDAARKSLHGLPTRCHHSITL